MIIGFAGPAGSGKTTAADYLVQFHGFRTISFAGPLKRMLAAVGLPEPADQEGKEAIIPWLGVSWRHCAQTLGTEWGRKLIHPDLWVIMALNNIDPERDYVVSDVRFENEAISIRAAGGQMIHLTGRAHPMTPGTQGHASEAGIVMVEGDTALNNGTLSINQLYQHLDAMVLANTP